MRSFLAVTGPKRDLWLVNTVGLLVTGIGVQLLWSSRSREASREVKPLAVGSAASLAGLEAHEVAKGVISPVYLLDAATEVCLGAMWARR
jgi:hypothetical protein